MVVKSATKKKLMDRGMDESMAHILATDRKWGDVIKLSPRELGEIVDRVEDAAIIIWLKIGGLEVKFDKGVAEEVFLLPTFMGDALYKYNFKTGVVTFIGEEQFRSLDSLFGDGGIDEWFSPHIISNEWGLDLRFSNVPRDATKEQEENLNSFLNMGVMKSILNKIENKLYLTIGYRQSINRLDVINFLVGENPLLSDNEEEDPNAGFDGLGSLFG